MDQLIFASLSHTHYWYEVGMLKVRAMLAVERDGGGLLCANNKPSTPRYSPLVKPAHPTDRPTDTIKQLFFGGELFLHFFCLRLAPFEPQESNQQNNNKNEPLFLYCSMPLLSCIITNLLTMYYGVFCFVMFGGSAWRLI